MISDKLLNMFIEQPEIFPTAVVEMATELLALRKAREGWQLVPVDPTEKMVIDGFESEPDEFWSGPEEWEKYQAMSGCEQAAHRAKLCYAAMLAAAPSPSDNL